MAQIEFAQTYNENNTKRAGIIQVECRRECLEDFDHKDLSMWRDGYQVGCIEENMRGYIDISLIWRELDQAIIDFTEPYKTAGISNISGIVDKLLRLEPSINCQCRPIGMVAPYCNIKKVSKGRYIQIEDEEAREKSKENTSASKIEHDYCSKEETTKLLKGLNFILLGCEKELGIKHTKSDQYKERFWKTFAKEIKTINAKKIEINITAMSNCPSRQLLENLIRSPAGIDYDKGTYGKQPDGVKDLLKRKNYETAAKHIHKKNNKIVLDENVRLIAKNNPV